MSQRKRRGLLHAVVEFKNSFMSDIKAPKIFHKNFLEPPEYFKCPSFMEFAVKTHYPLKCRQHLYPISSFLLPTFLKYTTACSSISVSRLYPSPSILQKCITIALHYHFKMNNKHLIHLKQCLLHENIIKTLRQLDYYIPRHCPLEYNLPFSCYVVFKGWIE